MPTHDRHRCARLVLLWASALILFGADLSGSPARAAAQDSPSPDEPATSPSADAPQPPASIRVGGDMSALVVFENGEYRSGDCRIPTPLPDGYPAPTPPGAIEVKRYPLVRRAEVDGALAPDLGMNMGFWPLFQHISRRQIAMTSPVEVQYEGFDPEEEKLPQRWTMAFLYRSPDDGPRGVDRSVRIVDAEPLTVVSMGFTGGTRLDRVRDNLAALDRWLESQPQWVRDGEPRALFYNGPEVPERRKWVEVQIPVKPSRPLDPPAARPVETPQISPDPEP